MKDRVLAVLRTIADDMRDDATAFEGKPFTGRNVAEYFGHQGAAIAALAEILSKVVESLPDAPEVPR